MVKCHRHIEASRKRCIESLILLQDRRRRRADDKARGEWVNEAMRESARKTYADLAARSKA
jgi:hypothetical protein